MIWKTEYPEIEKIVKKPINLKVHPTIRAWQLANVLRCGKTTVILSPAVGYKNALIMCCHSRITLSVKHDVIKVHLKVGVNQYPESGLYV